jgi:adenylate cyclase
MYITNNMAIYLTSNSIFVDVELAKMLSLIGVTIVLSLALVRARAALVNAVHGNAAASDLRQFFDPAVAQSITGSEDLPMAGRSETREVSVLFVDLRSFTTSAASLSPETVMEVLGLYQQAAVSEIERYGGQIDKFMGDGILATFGAVEESQTHAADALRTAAALVGAIDAVEPAVRKAGWVGPFHACCAAASGTATVGVVGALNRLEFTVIGTPVNLAAKLEAANKTEASRALTEGRTYDRAVAQGFDDKVLAFRRGRQIPGFSGQLDLVVLA